MPSTVQLATVTTVATRLYCSTYATLQSTVRPLTVTTAIDPQQRGGSGAAPAGLSHSPEGYEDPFGYLFPFFFNVRS
jgi:hypothetical protein